MSDQRCRTCKWLRPVLKASENDYWQCGYLKIPKPYRQILNLSSVRNGQYLLSVGDPDSDYGKTCPTWEGD